MSKTNGCSANLANKLNVLCVMLGKKRVSNAPSVLMARNTAKRVFLAVENETVVRIDFEASASKAAANVVDNLRALNYLSNKGEDFSCRARG